MPLLPPTAALYFLLLLVAVGRLCLARTKTQPSTKCEFSEANLRSGTRADVDYGERGEVFNDGTQKLIGTYDKSLGKFVTTK